MGHNVQIGYFAQNQDEYVLVQGLPRVDQTWLNALDMQAVLSQIPQLETIEKRQYRFFCGCNTQKILMVIRKMFASDPAELFGDQDQVEEDTIKRWYDHYYS